MTFVYVTHNRIDPGIIESGRCKFTESHPIDMPAAFPDAVHKWLANNDQGITILLSSCFSFSCSMNIEQKLRRNEQAVKFAIEEFLPVSAEQLDAEFINGSEIAVACDRSKVGSLVDSLVGETTRLNYVGYQALLASQYLISNQEAPKDCIMVLASRDELDLVQVAAGTIVDWNWFQADSANKYGIDLQIKLAQTRLPVYVFGDPGCQLPEFEPAAIDKRSNPVAIADMAFETSSKTRKGKWYPVTRLPDVDQVKLPDLENAISFLMIALTVLIFGLAGFAFWRAHQYRTLAGNIGDDIGALYHQAIPDGSGTSLVKRKLTSTLDELTQLSDAKEQLSGVSQIGIQLQRLLAATPNDIDFNTDRIEISADRIEISGVVTNGEYDNLASRFHDAGFEPVSSSNRRRTGAALGECEFRFVSKAVDEGMIE